MLCCCGHHLWRWGGGTTIPVHMVRASAVGYICSSSPVIVISHSAHTLVHVHLSHTHTHTDRHGTDTARYGCILIYEGKMRLDEQLCCWSTNKHAPQTLNFKKHSTESLSIFKCLAEFRLVLLLRGHCNSSKFHKRSHKSGFFGNNYFTCQKLTLMWCDFDL